MKMDFNVPYEVWCQRRREHRLREQAELRIRRPFVLPQIAEDIMAICTNSPKAEWTRWEIINAYSKQVGARGRVVRAERRLDALSSISGLIKIKLLEWGRRNHVRLADSEKHLQWIEDQNAAARNLPHPVLEQRCSCV